MLQCDLFLLWLCTVCAPIWFVTTRKKDLRGGPFTSKLHGNFGELVLRRGIRKGASDGHTASSARGSLNESSGWASEVKSDHFREPKPGPWGTPSARRDIRSNRCVCIKDVCIYQEYKYLLEDVGWTWTTTTTPTPPVGISALAPRVHARVLVYINMREGVGWTWQDLIRVRAP